MGATPIPIHRPSVGERELEAVRLVLESRWLGMGAVTAAFEERIRGVVGARHAVAVSSGSAALHLALLAAEVGPGSEVILPSLTHVACPQAVLAVGGQPQFCDVEIETATLDLDHAERLNAPGTRVIMPVHYGGFPCRMDELLELARDHGLLVVEDAAHAFGSACGGRPIGSLGDLTCFSFDAAKNITCAEGGAVTTNDEELAERIRAARNLGVRDDSWHRRAARRPWQYEATEVGIRCHLSDVHAAIGLVQLDRLDEIRGRKRELLRRYHAGLAGLDAVTPVAGDVDSACPLLCTVRIADGRRDALADHLARDGIQAWVHFPPCHLQPAFAPFRRPLPATEQLHGELLTLPLHLELSDADVDRVVSSIRAFFES